MTIHAHLIDIVFFRIDAGDPFPLTGGVRQVGMATQTDIAAAIDYQLFRVFRMVKSRAVAVFTSNGTVKILGTNLDHVAMALATVFVHVGFTGITVLDRLRLPLINVGGAVERVHKTVFAATEVAGNIEESEYQDPNNQCDDHKKRSPDMTFHYFFLPEKDIKLILL